MKDIFVVPEYAAEIDSHLREAELRTRPKPNYMRKQNDLTPQMRSILVDWLVEVSTIFSFLEKHKSLLKKTPLKICINRSQLNIN